MTYAKVAALYGVTEPTVGKWAKMYGIKRTTRGTNHRCSKLNAEDVQLIRQCRGIISAEELADKFDVTRTTIHDIWEYRTWLWLKDEKLIA